MSREISRVMDDLEFPEDATTGQDVHLVTGVVTQRHTASQYTEVSPQSLGPDHI
jgi:hypothetical protein